MVFYRDKLFGTLGEIIRSPGSIGYPCPLLEVDQVRTELTSPCGTLRDLFAVVLWLPSQVGSALCTFLLRLQ